MEHPLTDTQRAEFSRLLPIIEAGKQAERSAFGLLTILREVHNAPNAQLSPDCTKLITVENQKEN